MSQLYYQDCVQLQGYLKITTNQTEISRWLGFNQSTISREISRCTVLGIPYNADIARKDRRDKRRKANKKIHNKILVGSKLANYIEAKLEEYWSPEQIAGRWKIETGEGITHPTIYSFIYEHWPDKVKKYFRRRGKKYRKGKGKYDVIKNRISIHERPEIANNRERIGDFEGDTIIGKDRKDRIVTNVDRKSGFLMASLILYTKKSTLSIETMIALYKMMVDLPPDKKYTLTLDNGIEFAGHEGLSVGLKIAIYFADPYCSRQRGTNENTNGLLRRFLPKRTDFKETTDKELKYYVNLINARPRKRLGWKTPTEVFFGEI